MVEALTPSSRRVFQAAKILNMSVPDLVEHPKAEIYIREALDLDTWEQAFKTALRKNSK